MKLANTWSPKTKKERYLERKKLVYDHYGAMCKCCGEKNIMFLTVDHVNNDGNLSKTKKGYRRCGIYLYDLIINEAFPESYQLLCYNCNCGKHRNNGICPHISL